jgi:hypothetical protein
MRLKGLVHSSALKVALVGALAFALVDSGFGQAEQPQGSHMVRNKKYQLMLRPRDANRKDGTPIVLYPSQTWKCMGWRFEPMPGGVRLVNYFTGKSFEADGPMTGKPPVIQTPVAPERAEKQTWRFVVLGGGLYRIESLSGGVLTAIESEGGGDPQVVLAPWNDLESQKWELLNLPDRFTM